jgi:RNA polymerase sigma-70 factor (ECF subfamily)
MPQTKSYSDTYYVQAFQAGEEIGFDYFFKAFYKPLHFFAFRFIKDEAAIEDMISDAFITVWQKREGFSHPAILKKYLYVCIHHACIRWLEAQRLHTRHKQQAAAMAETTEKCFIDNIIRAETIHELHKALHSLPKACRIIFIKLYIEGKTMKETATKLKLAKSTVQTQKARGIILLKKKLLPSNS